MPTYPGNFLQDHFSFTLMYFVPIYWLLNWLTGTYTLILIQNSLIIVAAWYTYKLISLKSDNKWLGLGVLLLYFTLLGRYTTLSCDTNIAVMSACFIPVFIYFFETRKYRIATIIFILSLFSRENIPIWFLFIFIVLIINHKNDRKAVILSSVGIAISVLYFVLLFKVFIPSVETEEKQFTLFNYSALGATPVEAIRFIIYHPVETIKLFFVNHLSNPAYDGVKTEFYLVYLVSGGFILFLRPKYLIWFIPIVAQKVLNDSYLRWGIATYYSIEVVTLLPLSVFLALSELKRTGLQNKLIVVVCATTLLTTLYKLNPGNCQMPDTINSEKENIFSKDFWTADFNVGKVNKLFRLIPPGSKASVSEHLFPHLSQRQTIYLFPTVNDAKYVVFSVFDNYFMLSHHANEIARDKIFSSSEWNLVGSEFPVFLFKRAASGESAKNKLSFTADTLFCNFEQFDDLKKQVFFSDGTKADTLLRLSSEMSISGNHSLKLTPEDPFSSVIGFKDINRINYLEISVWIYPGSERPNIVASDRGKFYLASSESSEENELGWRKIYLGFWVPENVSPLKMAVYLWNSSSQPVYFDDLQIVKKQITH